MCALADSLGFSDTLTSRPRTCICTLNNGPVSCFSLPPSTRRPLPVGHVGARQTSRQGSLDSPISNHRAWLLTTTPRRCSNPCPNTTRLDETPSRLLFKHPPFRLALFAALDSCVLPSLPVTGLSLTSVFSLPPAPTRRCPLTPTSTSPSTSHTQITYLILPSRDAGNRSSPVLFENWDF